LNPGLASLTGLSPADISYGSGAPQAVQPLQLVAEAHAMAQADPKIAALAASLLASNPVALAGVAAANHVDKQTAAIILAKQMHPLRQMAGGGRPRAHEPVIVGERGPEVFVPDVPGTIVPQYFEEPYRAPHSAYPGNPVAMGETFGRLVRPAAWDAWLASRPESENVEDRRAAEDIAWDNRVRPKPPPLVQFPPAPESREKEEKKRKRNSAPGY
jgi:hypothetical protein